MSKTSDKLHLDVTTEDGRMTGNSITLLNAIKPSSVTRFVKHVQEDSITFFNRLYDPDDNFREVEYEEYEIEFELSYDI